MKYAPLSILFFVFLFSCSNPEKQRTAFAADDSSGVFHLPPEYEGRASTPYLYDADGNGTTDALLLLHNTKDIAIRHDTLVLFLYNATTRLFTQVSSVAIENAQNVQVENIDNDLVPELLVTTDAGGSSATASKGMVIFKLNNLTYQSILDIPFGAPAFVRVDSLPALELYDTFSGVFSRSESAVYLDSLLLLTPFTPHAYSMMRDRYFRNKEQGLLIRSDSLLRHPRKSDDYAQELFGVVVSRVMLLRKLHRDRESEEYMRSIIRKARFLPRRFKDALEEVQMDLS